MEKPSGYKYAKKEIKVLWDYINNLLFTISKGDQKYIQTEKKKIKYSIWEATHENQD